MRYLKFIAIIMGVFLMGRHIYINLGSSFLNLPDEKGLYWRFKIGRETKLEGRVLPYPPRPGSGIGTVIKGYLRFCTEKAYYIYQKEYIEKPRCRIPFWEKYSTNFFLLTDSEEITHAFKTMKEGDRIELEGCHLRFLGFYDSEGKEQYGAWGYRGFKFFYVKQVVINGSTISKRKLNGESEWRSTNFIQHSRFALRLISATT